MLLLLLTLMGCEEDVDLAHDAHDGHESMATGTDIEDVARWPDHVFEQHMISGCSTSTSVQTWTYDGQATGTLIITHGRTEYTDKYHHVVEALSDQPWNIVAWDSFGHGRSGGLRAHAVDYERNQQCDMDTVVDQFADPALPKFMLGHSMGGMMTARWLERHSGEASAAVLASPMMELVGQGVSHAAICAAAETTSSQGGAEVSTDPTVDPTVWVECEHEDQVYTHDCDMWDQFASDPYTQIGPSTWSWVASSCAAIDLTFDEVALNRTPTLALQSGQELIVNPDGVSDLCEDINAAGGDCTLRHWEGMYHELLIEVVRDEVIDEMVAHFLTNQ